MGNRFQIPFQLGTWTGLAAFAYFVMIWFTPFSPLGMARFGGFWIPILFTLLAVYRQKQANGAEGYGFGNAFLTGMATVLVLGSVKAVLVYMFIHFYDIGLIRDTNDEIIRMLETMRAYSPTPQEIDTQIELIREAGKKTTAFSMAAGEVNLYLIGGFPVSLFAALIFNRKPQHG